MMLSTGTLAARFSTHFSKSFARWQHVSSRRYRSRYCSFYSYDLLILSQQLLPAVQCERQNQKSDSTFPLKPSPATSRTLAHPISSNLPRDATQKWRKILAGTRLAEPKRGNQENSSALIVSLDGHCRL